MDLDRPSFNCGVLADKKNRCYLSVMKVFSWGILGMDERWWGSYSRGEANIAWDVCFYLK